MKAQINSTTESISEEDIEEIISKYGEFEYLENENIQLRTYKTIEDVTYRKEYDITIEKIWIDSYIAHIPPIGGQELGSCDCDLTGIQNEIANINNSITTINNRLNAFDSTITNINTKISTIETKIEEINVRINNIVSQSANVQPGVVYSLLDDSLGVTLFPPFVGTVEPGVTPPIVNFDVIRKFDKISVEYMSNFGGSSYYISFDDINNRWFTLTCAKANTKYSITLDVPKTETGFAKLNGGTTGTTLTITKVTAWALK